jgi:YcxB-like protein
MTVDLKGVLLRGADLDEFTRNPFKALKVWSRLGWLLVAIGLFAFAILSSYVHDPGLGEIIASSAFLYLAFVGFIVANVQRWRAAKRGYERSAFGNIPADFTFDEAGMNQVSAVSTSTFAWRQFEAIVENPRAVVLWMSPMHVYVIPKRYLDEMALQCLRDLIAAGVGAPKLSIGR